MLVPGWVESDALRPNAGLTSSIFTRIRVYLSLFRPPRDVETRGEIVERGELRPHSVSLYLTPPPFPFFSVSLSPPAPRCHDPWHTLLCLGDQYCRSIC